MVSGKAGWWWWRQAELQAKMYISSRKPSSRRRRFDRQWNQRWLGLSVLGGMSKHDAKAERLVLIGKGAIEMKGSLLSVSGQ